MPRAFASTFLLAALCGITGALAQSRHDPDAARVEQAALAFVKLLDDGRFDEGAAKLRADAAKFGPTSRVDLQQAIEIRRARGRLSNRQAMTVFVQPVQSQIVTGRDPAQQVRVVSVVFDTDPETPMLDRRRNAARYYRESVGGYLMPSGELLLTSYQGAPLHSSDRVAGALPTTVTPSTGPGTGTTAPEAVAL